MTINVTFLGTRGSYPQCGDNYREFGGHTSCISLQTGDNLYIIDAGSGLGKLAPLVQEKNLKKAHLFLSHLHMDHICGIPSFRPLWNQDFEVHVYCANEVSGAFGGASAALNTYFSPPYFPVSWKDFPAKQIHLDFNIGESLSPERGCKVETILLNHPGGACGYRFILEGKSIVYLSDTNHTDGIFESLVSFSQGADLVIYDSTFDTCQHKKFPHYGHSTWEKACELAIESRCKRLALHHHDYDKTDTELQDVERQSQERFAGAFAARCGQKVVL